MGVISLKGKDGVIQEVDEEVIKNASKTLSDMVEALGEVEKNEEIPIPTVKGAILKKVVEWATHHHKHKDDPEPEPEMEVEGVEKEKKTETTKKKGDDEAKISPWDSEFLLKMDQATLFDVILAANFLDIKDLLEVACKYVANMIRGRTPDEIRKTFNIRNTFTKEQEEQIKTENAWCEEK